MDISCIIPVYHEKEYLPQTISSVFEAVHNTPVPVEVIVVDDASIDGSRKVLQSLNLIYPFKLISLVANVGIAMARNIGAKRAKGEILVFTDADNLISPNFFAEVAKKARVPMWVGGGVRYPKLSYSSFPIRLCIFIFWALFCWLNHITIGAFWVRMDVFEKLRGFTTYHHFDDVDFALRMRNLARREGKQTKSLRESYIVWNTRFLKDRPWRWIKLYNPIDVLMGR